MWQVLASNPIEVIKQGPPPNPVYQYPTFINSIGKCLLSFCVAIGVEGIETLIQVLRLVRTWLELQITLLSFSMSFIEPYILILQTYLALAQQFLTQIRDFSNLLPLNTDIIKNCPPLQRLVDITSSILRGPFKIPNPFKPGQTLLLDIDGLIQDVQELLSITTELQFIKQFLREKLQVIDFLIEVLQSIKAQLTLQISI